MYMPRVTLYVADDLKARMDEVGEAVNWSAIAQRAFREAVSIHTLRKDPSDMKEVVERLRASKVRVQEEAFQSGQDYGRTWAKTNAEFDELQRIAESEQSEEFQRAIDNDDGVETLQRLIDPQEEMDRSDWESFWERHANVQPPSEVFARGFVDGAAEVYNEIADQL
jgi:hypothetical protein